MTCAGKTDRLHSCRNSGLDAQRRILNNDAVGGYGSDGATGEQIKIWRRLAVLNLVGTEDIVPKQPLEAVTSSERSSRSLAEDDATQRGYGNISSASRTP